MLIICSRRRPSYRSPGRRPEGPGHGPVKPESAGFGPIPGKTRGFLADTTYPVERARLDVFRQPLARAKVELSGHVDSVSEEGPLTPGNVEPRAVREVELTAEILTAATPVGRSGDEPDRFLHRLKERRR